VIETRQPLSTQEIFSQLQGREMAKEKKKDDKINEKRRKVEKEAKDTDGKKAGDTPVKSIADLFGDAATDPALEALFKGNVVHVGRS
jgi:phosphopantetheine adenylyltransferase